MKSQTELPFTIEKDAFSANILNIQVLDSTGKVVVNKIVDLSEVRSNNNSTSGNLKSE